MTWNGAVKLRALFIGCVEASEIFLKTLLDENADTGKIVSQKRVEKEWQE